MSLLMRGGAQGITNEVALAYTPHERETALGNAQLRLGRLLEEFNEMDVDTRLALAGRRADYAVQEVAVGDLPVAARKREYERQFDANQRHPNAQAEACLGLLKDHEDGVLGLPYAERRETEALVMIGMQKAVQPGTLGRLYMETARLHDAPQREIECLQQAAKYAETPHLKAECHLRLARASATHFEGGSEALVRGRAHMRLARDYLRQAKDEDVRTMFETEQSERPGTPLLARYDETTAQRIETHYEEKEGDFVFQDAVLDDLKTAIARARQANSGRPHAQIRLIPSGADRNALVVRPQGGGVATIDEHIDRYRINFVAGVRPPDVGAIVRSLKDAVQRSRLEDPIKGLAYLQLYRLDSPANQGAWADRIAALHRRFSANDDGQDRYLTKEGVHFRLGAAIVAAEHGQAERKRLANEPATTVPNEQRSLTWLRRQSQRRPDDLPVFDTPADYKNLWEAIRNFSAEGDAYGGDLLAQAALTLVADPLAAADREQLGRLMKITHQNTDSPYLLGMAVTIEAEHSHAGIKDRLQAYEKERNELVEYARKAKKTTFHAPTTLINAHYAYQDSLVRDLKLSTETYNYLIDDHSRLKAVERIADSTETLRKYWLDNIPAAAVQAQAKDGKRRVDAPAALRVVGQGVTIPPQSSAAYAAYQKDNIFKTTGLPLHALIKEVHAMDPILRQAVQLEGERLQSLAEIPKLSDGSVAKAEAMLRLLKAVSPRDHGARVQTRAELKIIFDELDVDHGRPNDATPNDALLSQIAFARGNIAEQIDLREGEKIREALKDYSSSAFLAVRALNDATSEQGKTVLLEALHRLRVLLDLTKSPETAAVLSPEMLRRISKDLKSAMTSANLEPPIGPRLSSAGSLLGMVAALGAKFGLEPVMESGRRRSGR